MQYSRLS